jgi:uncharacterized protein (TIGR02391 family)
MTVQPDSLGSQGIDRRELESIRRHIRLLRETVQQHTGPHFELADTAPEELDTLISRARRALASAGGSENLPSYVTQEGARYDKRTISKGSFLAAAVRLEAVVADVLGEEEPLVAALTREVEKLRSDLLAAQQHSITFVDDELRERCADLLSRPGKADTAVREACVVLEDRLRHAAGLGKETFGVDLVDKCLSPKDGKLVLTDIPAEQQGIHALYRGTIGFFKNPTSHRIIQDYDLTRARQVVGLVDTLLAVLRDAKPRDGPG